MAATNTGDQTDGVPVTGTLIEQALDLEEIDLNLFRSKTSWKPLGARGVFGGQVVAQALAAANRTVPDEFHIHSLHSYFLLPGDAAIPILYHVERTRDGRSFATRTVSAIQRGRAILTCQASYQILEENVISHQTLFWVFQRLIYDNVGNFSAADAGGTVTRLSASVCIAIENLRDHERYQEYLNNPKFSPKLKEWVQLRLNEPVPIDIRQCDAPADPFIARKIEPAHQLMWMKANGRLGNDQKLHQSVVAYASDFRLLGTGLLPHGLTFIHPRIRIMASLDHSMWFHEPFRADEWLLYELESPKLNNGRGLSMGRIYTQDGRLVVSVAQEGLIRVAPKQSNSTVGASKL